ncbi:MAG: methyltransferase domain-containing protein [bacterium]
MIKLWRLSLLKLIIKIIHRLIRYILPYKMHHKEIRLVASAYDMYSAPDEDFFASIYLKIIKDAIGDKGLKILDAGCGQGRLSIPLAKDGHIVTGVDLTEKAIEQGKKYANKAGVKIEFIIDDILHYLKESLENQFDCVICTEVVYMLPQYEEIIRNLVRTLKPGGILALGVRPKLYNVLYYIKNNNIEKALYISKNRDGNKLHWFFNWFTKEEIKEMLCALGMKELSIYGIGLISGIEGDPQSLFIQPSKLNEENRKKIFEIEVQLGPIYPDSGRYMLVIGKKGNKKCNQYTIV